MKLFRTQSWWNTIVPQVLGWIYFPILAMVVANWPFDHSWVHGYLSVYRYIAAYFIPALIGIAAFGYLFNDWCDIESDAAAGKSNRLAGLSATARLVIVVMPLLVGVGSWMVLNYLAGICLIPMSFANALFVAQIIALIMYSAKPFRLKERAELGAIFDAFYGHLNPVLITISIFGVVSRTGYWHFAFIFLLSVVCSVKGIRNILLHQIEDRKKDSSSRINTVVIKYGPWRVINFINNFLFPAEIFFLVCLTIVMCIHIPPMFIPLMLFAIISYLKLSGWKVGYADRRLLEFKFTYFMNDYYEGWFPVFTLIILSVYRHEFVFLLILHLLLFPRFTLNLVKDLKKINENFKTEEDY